MSLPFLIRRIQIRRVIQSINSGVSSFRNISNLLTDRPPIRLLSSITRQEIKMAEMDEKLLKRYTLPSDVPVVALDCTEAFNGLTLKEKLYAHYLSQACWVGGLIVNVQTSPESPAIYAILYDVFKTNGIRKVQDVAFGACGFSEEDWKAFLAYSCGIFTGFGNYKGFGDTKFIPGLSCEKFGLLIENTDCTTSFRTKMWEDVKERVYTLKEQYRQLGLGDKGITTYFSANCSADDAEVLARFLKHHKLEPWITRTLKTSLDGVPCYEIRSAAAVHTDMVNQQKISAAVRSILDVGPGGASCTVGSAPGQFRVAPMELQKIKDDVENKNRTDFEGAIFKLTTGDYSPLIQLVSEYLEKAKEFAGNTTERRMLESYIKSFRGGSIEDHKEGSKWWIKNQSPVIETYIGFIETYRDPVGVRGEFEGFVAVVNAELSKKFGALVENAEKILKTLPWPSEFERKTFMKPDFTSLDVLTFAGSGIPVGINIPNYDEIRQVDGFKNVTLGNRIIANFKDIDFPFFSNEDIETMKIYFVQAYELQTGLHELLGHGSGLNFVTNEDGTTNTPPDLRNPLTNKLVEGVYNPGDTYNSVFADLASSYEECRAETVGLYLSLDMEVHRIFGFNEVDAKKIMDVNWLTALYDGIRSLDMYQVDTNKWMQAHSQAAFVTLQVLIAASEDFVSIKETIGIDGKPDLLATLDLTLLDTVGKKALNDFLLKLQVYKSTADIQSARAMFESYSLVNDEGKYPWKSWREIVIERKLPRKVCVQANTFVSEDGNSTVILKSYEPTPTGIIQSVIERLPGVDVYGALVRCYQADKRHFP